MSWSQHLSDLMSLAKYAILFPLSCRILYKSQFGVIFLWLVVVIHVDPSVSIAIQYLFLLTIANGDICRISALNPRMFWVPLALSQVLPI
jgi:hypothetical protein